MEPSAEPLRGLEIHPVTAGRWDDLVTLFSVRGSCAGCWCMYWRVPHKEFKARGGEGLKLDMKNLVERGEIPGLLAYADGKPVGWVSVGPREVFPTLDSNQVRKRLDNQPTWSVVCFFIENSFRRSGLTLELLKAAVEYARSHGARRIEGYPIDPERDPMPAASLYAGLAAVFLAAGFKEVARPKQSRPFMRLEL